MRTSHSEAIIGKMVGGTPLAGHQHAHYLATDEDSDGRLDHVTVYAPCGFNPDDVRALGQLRRVFQSGNRPEVRTVLTGLGGREQFAQVPLFASARKWASVTPFSLPRFASRGAGKPPRPRDVPEAQLRRELRVRHLPEPISMQRLAGYAVDGRPTVRWLEFHTRRFKGEQGYGLAGFVMEFPEAVAGPIALGFACHFGLGLFMPA
jgi:CRISPR-associated protein Csb2